MNALLRLHVLRGHMQLEKQMTVLENRVDKAIQRLCGRQAETGRLRDSIDGLRKERLSLNEALAKLEAALAAQRAEAARLLRISQADCVGRDKVAMAPPSCCHTMSGCICGQLSGQLPSYRLHALCTCHAFACSLSRDFLKPHDPAAASMQSPVVKHIR